MSKERKVRRLRYELKAKRASEWNVEKRDGSFVQIAVPSDNGTTIKYLMRQEPTPRLST